ncbi:hypothetical protein QE152_g37264 [Popillia japonica]|uniref:CUB domain-containing protein n=1 Tax=Popillia japonica TaxID=7064 RepID=A0AAW1IAP0_POPJA
MQTCQWKTGDQKGNRVYDKNANLSVEENAVAFMTGDCSQQSSVNWFLDSGATDHMIPKFDESGSIDLSYKGELDNLNISKIYNSSSGQIQYVLNVEHPVKVDVKVIQLSPCDAKDYPLPPDVVIGELYIPSISDNFSLSDNCSYQIEVKANRHVLDIIYYIPDVSPINVDAANANVVREDRILFMQPFYNKDIDRIQYKIKWQDSVNDYSINIFPEGDHEHCKSNSPYSVQENATELLIPHLSSNFELRGNCKYVIQTTIDDQVRNITSYISGNLKVERMFLERIYNETINKIQYILRWPDVAPDEYKVDIINAESSASYCKKNFQGDFNSSNVEVHIPPTRNYDFSLNGNCKYIIEVRYDDKKTQIINDIPECIGPLCNCEILGPHPQEQLSIEREDAYFNISWLFPNNKTNNITNYGFYLFDNEDCNSSGKRRKLNPTKLSNNFALINVKHVMDGNCLSVSFNNSYHCPYSVVFLKLKEIQPTKLNSGSSWIFVLAATILFTLLYLTLLRNQRSQVDYNSLADRCPRPKAARVTILIIHLYVLLWIHFYKQIVLKN